MGKCHRNCAILLVASILASLAPTFAYAAGGRTLWTTSDDFAVAPTMNQGWTAGNPGEQSIAVVTTPDSDGGAINGDANYTNPGAAGTPGAMSVQWGTGTFNFFYGPDLVAKTDLRAYFGTQGLVQFDFIPPQVHVGNYFVLGSIFNYNGHFQFFNGTAGTTPNGNGYFKNTVTYTGYDNSAVVNYFQLGVLYNSNYSPLDPYYVDNFHVIGHGDINGDGHVNAADIKAMEDAIANPSAWQTTYGLSAANLVTLADFNGDSALTNADLQGFLNFLKAGNGTLSSVPEPASLLLLGLAVPALVVAGRRARKSK